MSTSLDALLIRRLLGRDAWRPPLGHGPDGWRFLSRDTVTNGVDTVPRQSLIVSVTPFYEGAEWVHASIANADPDDGIPGYDDLVLLHRAVFVDRYAYQMFVPPSTHINIHPRALHLWGRLDGRPAMPDFGALLGTI